MKDFGARAAPSPRDGSGPAGSGPAGSGPAGPQGRSGSALRRLDVTARLLYTAFLVFTVLGLVSAGLLHLDGMGTAAAQATTYWRGDDLGVAYPKSYRQLAELTHFHLFTEPVVLLVVAHLYNLGGDTRWRKAAAIVGTSVLMAAQIALPWGVAYGSPALGVALFPVNFGLLAGFLYMCALATWDMWGPRARS